MNRILSAIFLLFTYSWTPRVFCGLKSLTFWIWSTCCRPFPYYKWEDFYSWAGWMVFVDVYLFRQITPQSLIGITFCAFLLPKCIRKVQFVQKKFSCCGATAILFPLIISNPKWETLGNFGWKFYQRKKIVSKIRKRLTLFWSQIKVFQKTIF